MPPDREIRSNLLARLVLTGLILSGLTACVSGRPPAFEPKRTLDAAWRWLAPEVRLGESSVDAEWSERLTALIKEQAQAQGFELVAAPASPGDALRQRLLALLAARQTRGRGLLTEGTAVESRAGTLAAGSDRLGGIVALVRLVGFAGGDDRPAPMPPDITIPDPQNRPDYVVPTAPGPGSSSLVLELVIANADRGEVTLHRRVAIPNDHSGRWADGIESMVRQLLRGLAPESSAD